MDAKCGRVDVGNKIDSLLSSGGTERSMQAEMTATKKATFEPVCNI